MALPNAYTESDLASYLQIVVGGISDVLGWDSLGWQYTEAINEALAAYGTDDIATITGTTNIRKLRALARREIWRAIVAALSSFTDYSAPDGQSLKESQYQTQAETALAQAEADCRALGIDSGEGGIVGTIAVCYPHEHHHSNEFAGWWR